MAIPDVVPTFAWTKCLFSFFSDPANFQPSPRLDLRHWLPFGTRNRAEEAKILASAPQ